MSSERRETRSEKREASGEMREECDSPSPPLATSYSPLPSSSPLATNNSPLPVPSPLPASSPLLRNLAAYDNSYFDPGRGVTVRLVWYYVSLLLFESGWFPVSHLKCWVLQRFGANIGRGVVIKPHVRIKYPWKLSIGDHCWIGQGAWLDSLDQITLESDVCISQEAYLCTGSHDHRSPTFELRTAPILVKHGAWIAARAIVLGGAVVERGEVVPAGSIKSRPLASSL